MEYKPSEVANKLDVGTSALRHYEKWGIVPPAKRKANGYRVYTDEHIAYFQCIRAMYAGFGMATVRKIMPMIQKHQFTEALWEVNKLQAAFYQKKQDALQVLSILQPNEMENFLQKHPEKWYTIGEVEKLTNVPATTIRHWETEGLLTPDRHPENGYRLYNREHIRRLLIIHTVQASVFLLNTVRDILAKIDDHDVTKAKEIAEESLHAMDRQIEYQLRTSYYLYKLIQIIDVSQFHNY